MAVNNRRNSTHKVHIRDIDDIDNWSTWKVSYQCSQHPLQLCPWRPGFFITEYHRIHNSKELKTNAKSACCWICCRLVSTFLLCFVLPCTSFLLYHSHFLSNSTYFSTSHSRTKAAPRLKHRCRGSSTRKKCHQQLQCNHPGSASGWTMLKYKDLKSVKVIPSHTQKALPSVPTGSQPVLLQVILWLTRSLWSNSFLPQSIGLTVPDSYRILQDPTGLDLAKWLCQGAKSRLERCLSLPVVHPCPVIESFADASASKAHHKLYPPQALPLQSRLGTSFAMPHYQEMRQVRCIPLVFLNVQLRHWPASDSASFYCLSW